MPQDQTLKLTRPMKFLVWSLGLYVAMLCAESIGLLDSQERWLKTFYPKLDNQTYDLTTPGVMYRPNMLLVANRWLLRLGWVAKQSSLLPTTFFFGTTLFDNENYLKGCLEVTKYLKKAGASAVMVELPFDLDVLESTKNTIRQLNETRVVVFGQWMRHDDVEITHPLFRKQRIQWAAITAKTRPEERGIFFPFSVKERFDGSTVPDISIALIGMQEGDRDSLAVSEDFEGVRLHNYVIPTSPDGSVMINYAGRGGKNWYDQSGLWGEMDPKRGLRLKISGEYPEKHHTQEELDSIATAKYKGAIVLLFSWQTSRPDHDEGIWRMLSDYLAIVGMIQTGQFITRMDGWDPLLVLFLAAFIAWCSYSLKPSLSILSLTLNAVALWVGSLWLCNHFDIYWPATYPLATTIIGGLVLTGVKRSYNRQNAYESTIEVLENRAHSMDSELRTAHHMQMDLMPTKDPRVPGFLISGSCKPAETVGGDYFDYIWIDEDKTKLGIAMADVSGKAMKAAMTAVMTSGLIVREIGGNSHPSEILRKINLPMHLKTEKKMFTAMALAMIDTKTKQLTLANAGQMEPLLKRGNDVMRLRTDGMRIPLGAQEKVSYNETVLQLQTGDLILMFTDGLSEATNGNGEMFGVERIEGFLKNFKTPTIAAYLLQSMFREVEEFSGSTPQHDDMTAVAIQVE